MWSSSWLGSTFNWTKPADEGWSAARLVPASTVALDISFRNVPYGLPPPSTGPPIRPGHVQHNSNSNSNSSRSRSCDDTGGYLVSAAGDASVNGCYMPAGDGTYQLKPSRPTEPSASHGASSEEIASSAAALSLYSEQDTWRIGIHGKPPLLYVATASSATPPQHAWGCASSRSSGVCPPPDVVGHGQGPTPTPAVESWTYRFDAMIVGSAVVPAAAWSGAGTLTLEYCEVLAQPGVCRRFSGAGFDVHGTVDTHIVDSSVAMGDLSTHFSWRGFQHVLVKTTGTVKFAGTIDSLFATWVAVDLEETADIQFEGGDEQATATLASIRDMVKRTERSNTVSGLPTDCPTREKHGWLGDALDSAVASMFSFWTPTVYRLFLEQIAAAQAHGSPAVDGYVPVVVPCHRGVDAGMNDISWTAGFVMVTRWLLLYYGDVDAAHTYYMPLRRWVEGQLRNATSTEAAPGPGLPDFSCYGDLSSNFMNAANRKDVGQKAAAANFLVALGAMVELAEQTGEREDAARYAKVLEELRATYDSRWWDPHTDSWSPIDTNVTLQTVTSLALAASVGTARHRAASTKALVSNVVAGDYLLTVGNEGQRTVLTELSGAGSAGHDAALRLATQPKFPGWGYWAAQNFSTCLEGWSNLTNPALDHYHGSYNHGWLCGGVGEWLYKDLGGISPGANGYATVTIAPKISATLGPDHVSMSLRTVRGVVLSNWTRAPRRPPSVVATNQHADHLGPGVVLELSVRIPVLAAASVVLPLLDHGQNIGNTRHAQLDAGATNTNTSGWRTHVCVVQHGGTCAAIWSSAPAENAADALPGCSGVSEVRHMIESHALRFALAAGSFTFRVARS